jgi:hypothetical protein
LAGCERRGEARRRRGCERCSSSPVTKRPARKPAAVTRSPAATSKTKWFPVATTASVTVGPQSSASALAQGLRSATATAMPTANAEPACRLGLLRRGCRSLSRAPCFAAVGRSPRSAFDTTISSRPVLPCHLLAGMADSRAREGRLWKPSRPTKSRRSGAGRPRTVLGSGASPSRRTTCLAASTASERPAGKLSGRSSTSSASTARRAERPD